MCMLVRAGAGGGERAPTLSRPVYNNPIEMYTWNLDRTDVTTAC